MGRDLFAEEPQEDKGRDLFAETPVLEPDVQPTEGDVGILEPAATLATAAIAEPVAGIAGTLASIAPVGGAGSAFGEAFAEPSEIGPAGPEIGTRAIEAVREAGTFIPRSEEGKRGLQKTGEFLEPVATTLQGAEAFLGDETFEATGSPALAAAATTIPSVILEMLGLAATKGIIKTTGRTKQLVKTLKDRKIKKAIIESAPEIEQIKDASRAVYTELTESGVAVKPEAFKSLVSKIDSNLKAAKFTPRRGKETANTMKFVKEEVGKLQTLDDMDNIRRDAQGNLSKGASDNDKRFSRIITETMDEFIDEADVDSFTKGTLSPNEIRPKYKMAASLWGRARRAELVNDAFKNAELARGGIGKGIVSEFNKILRNKRVNRFFTPEEIEGMRAVSKGGTIKDVAEYVGRFGGPIGLAIGGGFFGSAGMVGLPILGQTSRRLATRLTTGGAEFLDTVIRAGSDADAIARAYIKNTPRKLRKAEELSELFLKPNVDLKAIESSKNPFLRKAANIARGMRVMGAKAIPTTKQSIPGSLSVISATKQLNERGER